MKKINDTDFYSYCSINFFHIILKYITKKEASYFYKRIMDESLFSLFQDPENLFENVKNLHVDEGFNIHLKTSIVQGQKQRDLYKARPYGLVLTIVIANYLSTILERKFSDSLYSFRKNRGRELALKDLSAKRKFIKNRSFYKGDVSGYGDNIDQSILIEKVSRIVDPDSKLFQVLKSFISISYLENDSLKVMGKGIPTGSPLTPVFENIYLMTLDDLMNTLKDANYYRYGDDLLVLSESKETIALAAKKIKVHLNELKLEIKPTKEFFQYSSDTTSSYSEWLGFAFNQDLDLTTRQKYQDEFKTDLKKRINLHLFNLKSLGLDKVQILDETVGIYSNLINPFNNQLAYKYLLYTEVDLYVKKMDHYLRSYVEKVLFRKTNIPKSIIRKKMTQHTGLSLNFFRRLLDKKRREGYLG